MLMILHQQLLVMGKKLYEPLNFISVFCIFFSSPPEDQGSLRDNKTSDPVLPSLEPPRTNDWSKELDALTDTILIMHKPKGDHLSNIGNRFEMADYLRRWFPHYDVKIVAWPDYKMLDQVRIMSRTRAMISLPGSDIMNGIFVAFMKFFDFFFINSNRL